MVPLLKPLYIPNTCKRTNVSQNWRNLPDYGQIDHFSLLKWLYFRNQYSIIFQKAQSHKSMVVGRISCSRQLNLQLIIIFIEAIPLGPGVVIFRYIISLRMPLIGLFLSSRHMTSGNTMAGSEAILAGMKAITDKLDTLQEEVNELKRRSHSKSVSRSEDSDRDPRRRHYRSRSRSSTPRRRRSSSRGRYPTGGSRRARSRAEHEGRRPRTPSRTREKSPPPGGTGWTQLSQR